MASVAGLICSVGSDCHFERTGMRSRPQEQAADTIIVVGEGRGTESLVVSRESPVVDAYLDHLRVERRLAGHTLESYARDLRALAAYAAGAGRAVESLDRPALEAFVREQRGRGLSPRSVARMVAAVRGFFRFLVLDRRLDEQPRRRSAAAARVAGAPDLPLARGSRHADRAAGHDRDARPARSRDDRAALRHRAAGHRTGRRPPRRSAPRRALPDLHRQGQQGTAGADRRAGDRLDPRPTWRRPGASC